MSSSPPPTAFPDPDQLDVSWDQVEQLVREAIRPTENRPRRRPPTAKARLFYDLWRIEHLSQRQIAKRHGTTQSAVFRACHAVEKWLGCATSEELRELPAEEKFRAAVRIHERKAVYAERLMLREYRRSNQPQVTTQERVRKKPDEAQGELERWEVTTTRPRQRDPRFLDRYVKLSRDELALAGRRLPMNVHADPSLPFEASADEVRQSEQRIQQLVEELEILHREYVQRLTAHQRIYGYMDQYGLKRQYVPSSPLGGWVPQEDFAARRDQPGVFTHGQRYEDVISGESVFGPPEQWQVGTPQWFDRLRAQAAAAGGQGSEFAAEGSPAPDADQESGAGQLSGYEGVSVTGNEDDGVRGKADRESSPTPADPHTRTPGGPAAASQAASLPESTPRVESPESGENPRENPAESALGESRESESPTRISEGPASPPDPPLTTHKSPLTAADSPLTDPTRCMPRGQLTQAERWERNCQRLERRAAEYERDRALEAERRKRQASG